MRRTVRIPKYLIFCASLVGFCVPYAAGADVPIAGTTPDQRPEGAPVIQQVEKDSDWYQRALTGLNPPHPYNFRFLEDQGNWHTPFNRPGMTGPYDIRGWHKPSEQ